MGGFITSAARLARNNIRPLLLPAPNQPPSVVKRIYDLAGNVLSILVLNYAAAPFMILTVTDSLAVWKRLGFYGHIIVFGGLLFFRVGGSGYFKRLQVKRGIVEQAKKPKGAANGTSPSQT